MESQREFHFEELSFIEKILFPIGIAAGGFAVGNTFNGNLENPKYTLIAAGVMTLALFAGMGSLIYRKNQGNREY